ncbi:hypothetical protein DBR11_12295 [Pedobacter sp. HMWF019]|uniref:DUF3857 domain-containing protein n=1 Tax=Pedobacter sp. HMWF019 TaxID=2056856 RepID=UPI000D3B6101|nr:DUF3857 domain-containing protein [Pedobacter sp. HMWF019]PTS99481.1 hypothetical protein DBR11_12295 [Pedobacter sp. HMWF019]
MKNLFNKHCYCLILSLSTLLCYGQGKNFSVSRNTPSWIVRINLNGKQPKEKGINDGYYSALVDQQNQAELKENYIHVIRQIVSDAGVQNGSQISVTYDPSYEKLIFHNITIWRNNKPADKLDASKFKILQNEKDLSRFIYSGTYDAYLILDDVRKGDRIEYSYTRKGTNPIFGTKYANTFYFENSSSAGQRYTNLIINKSRSLQLKNFNFKTAPKITEMGGLRMYEWESSLTDTYRNVDYSPSWYEPFKYTQVTEYQNWEEVVNWGLKTNSYPGLKTLLLDKKATELLRLAGNKPEKYIQLAVRFVQDEIRYMGVEMGVYSQRPNSPEKVLQQRYGDCKDKSLLLIYLLNKANVNAYMAYIDTYSGKNTTDFLPSPMLFNHAVVVIEHKQSKIWIDPTISYQRGAYDSIYFPNYGQGLVLKPGVKHPESVVSIATGKLVSNLVFDLADTSGKKATTLTIKSTYTDNYADDIRSTIADEGQDDLQKSFLEYITKYYPDAENIKPIAIDDNEESNTINITEYYQIEDIWKKEDSEDHHVNFYGDLIYAELRNIKPKNRIEPMSLKFPVNIEENVYINLPKAWSIEEQNKRVETDNYYFEFNSFIRGNQLRLNYSYRSMKDYIEGKDIKAYVKDTREIKDHLSFYLSWGNNDASIAENSNPYLLGLAILIFLISGIFFVRIYQKKTEFDLEQMAESRSIGGWIIFTAIILSLSPISIIGEANLSAAFSSSTWQWINSLKGSAKFFAGTYYTIEVIAIALKMSWVILLLFLFYNRRTSFPERYIQYLHFLICVVLIRFAGDCYINFLAERPVFPDTTTTMTRIFAIGFCILWMVCYQRSNRVKETFVFTYPEVLWKKELIEYKNSQISAYFSRQNHTSETKEPQTEGPDLTNTPKDENV